MFDGGECQCVSWFIRDKPRQKTKNTKKKTSDKCDLLYRIVWLICTKKNEFKRYERACVTKDRTIKVKLMQNESFISVTLTQETDVVYFYPCL